MFLIILNYINDLLYSFCLFYIIQNHINTKEKNDSFCHRDNNLNTPMGFILEKQNTILFLMVFLLL